MSTTLTYQTEKIKMPRWALELAVKNGRTCKLFSAYFSFRGLFPNGVVLYGEGKVLEIAKARCEHYKSTNTWVDEMIAAKLVKVDADDETKLHIISLKEFAALYGYEGREHYHYIKTTDKLKFEYVVRAHYLKIRKNEQNAVVIHRIKRSHQVDSRKAAKLAGELLSSRLKAFSANTVPDYFYNTDVSISQGKIAEYFGCQSQASGTYWTKVLEKKRLLTVTNREVHSPNFCRDRGLGFVMMAPKGRGTVLVMPNLLNFSF